MEKKLRFCDYLFVGSMLFGLFFGAGNLIFPVHMGQEAGSNIFMANLGTPELASVHLSLIFKEWKRITFSRLLSPCSLVCLAPAITTDGHSSWGLGLPFLSIGLLSLS